MTSITVTLGFLAFGVLFIKSSFFHLPPSMVFPGKLALPIAAVFVLVMALDSLMEFRFFEIAFWCSLALAGVHF